MRIEEQHFRHTSTLAKKIWSIKGVEEKIFSYS